VPQRREEPGGLGAVHRAVIPAQPEDRHRPDRDRVVNHDRAVDDRLHVEDRDLGWLMIGVEISVPNDPRFVIV
jgi:hypothetical protein